MSIGKHDKCIRIKEDFFKDELDIRNKLDFNEEGCLVEDTIYNLNKDELERLGVSTLSPKELEVELREVKEIGNKNFLIKIHFFIEGVKIRKEDISKSFIFYHDSIYLMPENVAKAMKLVDGMEFDPKDFFLSQSEFVRKVKSLASSSPYFKLSQYLRTNEFVAIHPALRMNITDSNEATVALGIDGIDETKEQKCLERVRQNPELGYQEKEKRGEKGKKEEEVRILYKVPESKYGVFKKIRNLEDYVKKKYNGHVPHKEIPKLLKSIKNQLEDEIDLTDLSDRIKGWGIFIRRELPQFVPQKSEEFLVLTFPSIPLKGKHLKGDESTLARSLESVAMNTLEKNCEITELVKKAKKEKSPCIEYKNQIIQVEPHDETLEMLERNRILLEAKKEKNLEGRKRLLAKYNIDIQEYSVLVESKNQKVKDHLCGRIPKFLRSEVSSGRKLELFDYQWDGINWFIEVGKIDPENSCGGLLSDVMGLGKTLQAIAYLAYLAENKKLQKALIICPKTLLKNWEDEFRKFVDENKWKPNVLSIESFRAVKESRWKTPLKKGEPTVIITSYPQIRRNYEKLCEYNFDILICDEAQEFKNPALLLHNAMECLKAKRKFALTGTPVENRLSDLWAIMDIVKPGLLRTLRDFQEEFEKPLQSVPDEGPERDMFSEKLKERMGIYFFRRTKKVLKEEGELKECYDKISSDLFCTDRLLQVYHNAEERRKSNPETLIGIIEDIRLRSSNVTRYPENEHSINELIDFNVKLPWLFGIIDSIKKKNEKLLIFERFGANIRMLKYLLEDRYPELYPIKYINQEIKSKERRASIVAEFEKDPNFGLLLLTPRTAGVGLNLVSANHVVHFTREWNPAKEAQATDRAYRCGQKKDVYVYYPITVFPEKPEYEGYKTIEERVHSVLMGKKQLIEDFTHSAAKMDMDYGKFLRSEGEQEDIDPEQRDFKKSIRIEDTFNYLNGHEFEAFCALLLKELPKYDDYEIVLTPRSGDKGVDIVAIKEQNKSVHLFECKKVKEPGKKLSRRGVEQISTASQRFVFSGYEVLSKNILTNVEDCSTNLEDEMSHLGIEVQFYSDLERMIKDCCVINLDQVQSQDMNRKKFSHYRN